MSGNLDEARERLRVQMASSRPLLSPRDLAKQLSLSERTIRQMLSDGDIPSYRIGGARRVDPADLDAYLAEHRQGARRQRSTR